MKQVMINLYSFDELGKEAQEKAITEHSEFLTSMDEEGQEYNREETIENIKINDYIFFEDGALAHCIYYTGTHQKSGTTEFKFHGRIYDITN